MDAAAVLTRVPSLSSGSRGRRSRLLQHIGHRDAPLIGLSNGNTGTGPSEIKFALRLQNGSAEVREGGLYKAETSFMAGDVLKVAVVGGAVTYSKNGTVFYTSATKPAYPLLVDTSLFDLAATLSSAMISGTWTQATQAQSLMALAR